MKKIDGRDRRRISIRKKIIGTEERPRLALKRSNRDIYVQVIDDIQGKTICGLSAKSSSGNGAKTEATCNNVNFAAKLGESIAKTAKEKGVTTIVFDRSGYKYHGVVKALAEGARKGGLVF